jgi:hypothetical protein
LTPQSEFITEMNGNLLNNSGANSIFTYRLTFNGTTYLTLADGSVATSANSSVVLITASIRVYSSSSAYLELRVWRNAAGALGSKTLHSTSLGGVVANTTTNNLTTGGLLQIDISSSTSTATQQFTRRMVKSQLIV